MDRKLGKNLVMSIGYNLLSMIVPFITAPYLGRVLGANNVGSYTYVHSIAAYFVMFGQLLNIIRVKRFSDNLFI